MNRRRFLGCIPAAALAQSGQWVTPAARPVIGLHDIADRKQLFLDGLLLDQMTRVSLLQGRPDKYPQNPVIRPDQPWEQLTQQDWGGVQISGQSVLFDAEEKLFKCWYWISFTGGDAASGRLWAYATSRDGYRWEKPALGEVAWRGSQRNNLLVRDNWGSGDGYFNVFKDPRERDPARRYKALGFTWGAVGTKAGATVAFSPDGIRWTEHPGNPVVPQGVEIVDVPTILGWDERRGKYVAYPRPGHPKARKFSSGEPIPNSSTGDLRAIGYAESDDFLVWSPTRVMLTPDEEDRVDYQYYQMVAAPYGEFYVGLLAMHQTHEQTFENFLLTSRDGFHWNWADRKKPLLERGALGSYDAGYATPSGPIVHDGKIWIYYGAYSGAHSLRLSRLGPNIFTIALATLPLDRWVGILAGPSEGMVLTNPFTFRGSRLLVDLDAAMPVVRGPRPYERCVVRAELTDANATRIEKFSLERCEALSQSGRAELRWKGAEVGELEGKPVRLRFTLRSAALYSFQFLSQANL